MSNKKNIDTRKCQNLGDNIWYDKDTDMFYMYDKNMDIYIEVEGDITDTDEE